MSELLRQFLVSLMGAVGPAIIQCSLSWLQALTPEQTQEVANAISKAIAGSANTKA